MIAANPQAYVRQMAKAAGISMARAERIWGHAKDAARAYGRPGTDRYWAAVTGIFRNIVTGKVSQNPPEFNAAFWKWFGGSVVRNDDGSPMVVYHGTSHGFSQFDPDRQGRVFTQYRARKGFFFTSSAAEAGYSAEYARIFTEGEDVIMPVYLSIQNPYVRKSGGKHPQKWFDSNWEVLQETAMSGGHDGVIIIGTGKGKGRATFVVYHPTQIKSVYNAGTWDPSDPDIRRNPRRRR